MAITLLVSDLHINDFNDTLEDIQRIDGCDVTEKTFNFAIALREQRAFKGCRFGTKHSSYNDNSLWVYFPDEIFCRGEIGYRDVSLKNNTSTHKYFVSSHSIHNHKVAYYKTTAQQQKVSESLDRITVVAKSHLREYPVEKIWQHSSDELLRRLNTAGSESNTEKITTRDVLKNALGIGGCLVAELRTMVNNNYMFHDERLKQYVVDHLQAIDNHEKVSEQKITISLVAFYGDRLNGDTRRIVVYRGQSYYNAYRLTNLSQIETDFIKEEYTQDTLPDNLAAAVSSLAILENDAHIEGLGYRHSENLFYVIEHEAA